MINDVIINDGVILSKRLQRNPHEHPQETNIFSHFPSFCWEPDAKFVAATHETLTVATRRAHAGDIQ